SPARAASAHLQSRSSGDSMRRSLFSAGLSALVVTVMAATVPVASASRPGGLRAAATATCALPKFGPGNRYHPRIRARDFTPHVTNAWFPLTPGKVLVYTGDKDRVPAIDIFDPTPRTNVIDHVRTRVVEDRLYTNGFLAERTIDY